MAMRARGRGCEKREERGGEAGVAAYAAGLTDWDMASMYGKLCIFAFAAWAGSNGGVIAGLAICGVVLSTTNAAAGPSPRSYMRVDPSLFCLW